MSWQERDRQLMESNQGLRGAKTFDWPSVVDGANSSTTVPCPGAKLGDFAVASMTVALGVGVILSAFVSAADVVTVVLHNESGAPADLASGTLSVFVEPRIAYVQPV